MYPRWRRTPAQPVVRFLTQWRAHPGNGWGHGIGGPDLDAPLLHEPAGAESCFKCPKRRSPGEPGWYFVHFTDAHRVPGPCRLYVCPKDYFQFAALERERWVPVLEGGHEGPPGNGVSSSPTSWPFPNESAPVHEGAACSADELITLLTRRGLAGWAFLVRDVAAGRVRRLHLRQLPAEPEIRSALVTYLHSAGTAVTISRIFMNHQHSGNGK